MHQLADLNGEIVGTNEARVTAVGAAALIGKGVFTTVAILERDPFLLNKHLFRLEANARAVGIRIGGFDLGGIVSRLRSLIEANTVRNGKARITIFDSGPTGVWDAGSGPGISSIIVTGDSKKRADAIRLSVSPYRLSSSSPLAGIKTCNYLEQTLALEEAKKQGADEALRLNERGEIAGGAMSNIFWVNGGLLYTPSLKTGCLPGTTRSYILENSSCVQTEAAIEELFDADAVYLTSAGLGIARVAEIEGQRLSEARHEIEVLWPD